MAEKEQNFLEKTFGDVTTPVDGALARVSNSVADSLGGADKTFTKEDIRAAMPVVGAVATAGAGYFMWDPLQKAGKFLASGVKNLVTGFGYFEKIPLAGGLFTAVGKGVDAVSDGVGAAIAGAGTFLMYRALKVPPPPPVAPTGTDHSLDQPRGPGDIPAPVRSNYKPPKALEQAAEQRDQARKKLQEVFRKTAEKGELATKEQIKKLKEAFGEEGYRDLHRRSFGSEPAGESPHPEMTKARAGALLDFMDAHSKHGLEALNEGHAQAKAGMAGKTWNWVVRKTMRPFGRWISVKDVAVPNSDQVKVQHDTMMKQMRDGLVREAAELIQAGQNSGSQALSEYTPYKDPAIEKAIERVKDAQAAYGAEACEAVSDTLHWMRNHGNSAEHRAANEILNDPAAVQKLLEGYKNAPEATQADLGYLSGEVMKAFRQKLVDAGALEIQGIRKIIDPKMEKVAEHGLTDARIEELSRFARETLEHMHSDKAPDAMRRAAAELTPSQVREGMLRFHELQGTTEAKSMTECLVEAASKSAAELNKAAEKVKTSRKGKKATVEKPTTDTNIEPIVVNPVDAIVDGVAKARGEQNAANGRGPAEYAPESIDAVKDTIKKMQKDGSRLRSRAAADLLANPHMVGDLLDMHHSDPQVRAKPDLLIDAVIKGFRMNLMAEATGIIASKGLIGTQKGVSVSEMAQIESATMKVLEGMQASTGVSPDGQRTGEVVTPEQLAEVMMEQVEATRAAKAKAIAEAPVKVSSAAPGEGAAEAAPGEGGAKPAEVSEAGLRGVDVQKINTRLMELAKDAKPPVDAAPLVDLAAFRKTSPTRAIGTAFDAMVIMNFLQHAYEKKEPLKKGDIIERKRDGTFIVVTQPGDRSASINLSQPVIAQHVDKDGKPLGPSMGFTVIDPDKIARTYAGQGTMAAGGGLNAAGRSMERWGGLEAAKRGGGLQKWGGRLMVAGFVIEQGIESWQDVKNDNGTGRGYSKAGARTSGSIANGLIWVYGGPVGFLAGTAPTRFATEWEAYMNGETKSMDGDGIILETLPGMFIAPAREIGAITVDMMQSLPKSKVVQLAEGQSIDLDKMYKEFPQYRNAVLMLPIRSKPGEKPPTQEEIEERRKKMLSDPIHAWMEICKSEGKEFNFGSEEANRKAAGEHLMRLSVMTQDDVTPDAMMTYVYGVGHRVEELATGVSTMNFDDTMRMNAMVAAAREIRQYAEMRYASADNPYRGTEVQGQAPVTATIAKISVPIEPQPVPRPEGIDQKIMDASYQQNADAIRAMLKKNAGALTDTAAYAAWMRFDNQQSRRMRLCRWRLPSASPSLPVTRGCIRTGITSPRTLRYLQRNMRSM
ncbi:MAG: hypothetical protein EBV03_04485 [Proteobacteria bacterium]|nr:hypothetical protein [Pseudomonadota bacterium]